MLTRTYLTKHCSLSPLLLLLAASVLFAACSEPAGEQVRLPELATGWSKIEPGGETRCALDTPYAFWVRPGTENKLLIYFQGGGGCWDASSCSPGSRLYDQELNESDSPGALAANGGFLDLDNPANPFHNYYALYIPYCTGDIHWGDNVATYEKVDEEPFTIYHRGFVNATSALDWASDAFSAPESIFISGCSAGSMGSIFHAPYIIERFPEAEVAHLGDSYAGVFPRPLKLGGNAQSGRNLPDWIPELATSASDDLTIADLYVAVANYYPERTFSQFNMANDQVQAAYYVALGGQSADFAGAIEANLSSIHAQAPTFRSFTAPGNDHCPLLGTYFYRAVEGTEELTPRDWVADLAEDGTVDSVQGAGVSVDESADQE